MKKIALLLLTLITISCTQSKHEIKTEDMQGQWKTLQQKVNGTDPVFDVNCDGDNGTRKADTYTLNADGSFSVKDICTGKPEPDQQKQKWKFEDHILTMEYTYKGKEMKVVYSVVDMGDNKVKWKLLYTRYDMNYTLEDIGYYLVMQKQ